jgi:hypothetical protein
MSRLLNLNLILSILLLSYLIKGTVMRVIRKNISVFLFLTGLLFGFQAQAIVCPPSLDLGAAVGVLKGVIGVIPDEFETEMVANFKKVNNGHDTVNRAITVCELVKNKDDIEAAFLTIDLISDWIPFWSGPYVGALTDMARAEVQAIKTIGQTTRAYNLAIADQLQIKIKINDATHCWIMLLCNNPLSDNKISDEIKEWVIMGRRSDGSYGVVTDVDISSRTTINYSPSTFGAPGRPGTVIRIIFKNGQRFHVYAIPEKVTFERTVFSPVTGIILPIIVPTFIKRGNLYSYE